MFDIASVREADDRASKALGATWQMTELDDWTHASPSMVNQGVIWPWFASLGPSDAHELEVARGAAAFDGAFLSILRELAPEMFGV